MGGSSAINILAMVYPNRSSIDCWGKLGNKGWDWDVLSPYYRKFQTYMPPSELSRTSLTVDYVDDSIQGSSGPIKSSYPEFVGPLAKAWPGTFRNLGWNMTGDPISGSSLGAFNGPYTVNPDGRERSHAGNEYYVPVSGRNNLHLMTNVSVERIMFEAAPPPSGEVIAHGVQVVRNNERHTILAKKEVVLAAGVFQSPQLLELSGIGAPQILKRFGIEVVVSNPNVGTNLQDHCMTGVCYEVKDGVPTADMRRDPNFGASAKEQYEKSRSGPLTSGITSLAFMPLKNWVPTDQSEPDISQVLDQNLSNADQTVDPSGPAIHEQHSLIRSIVENPTEASIQLCLAPSQMHFDKSTYQEVFAVTQPGGFVAFLVSLPHPFSHGSVHIGSNSYRDPPIIDPKFMSHPLDAEIMGRHMLALEKIVNTEPLADLVKPGGRVLPLGTDLTTLDKAKEHCKSNLRSTSHPCGTCAMLPREKGGVVDERLRVYGVKGLRIVDASIFPMVPRGNIQSTVYAVAERAADLIKADWSA